MGASPGGAESGAGAGIATQAAKAAAKIVKEAVRGIVEVAKKPGEMAAFARRGLSYRKTEGPSAVMPDLAKPAGGSQAPESPVQAPVTETTATAQPAPDVLATAARATNKDAPLLPADAAREAELTGEAREMAAAQKAEGGENATQASASDVTEAVTPEAAKAGAEQTHTGSQQTKGEKPWRVPLRARMSKEYRQAMKKLRAEATDEDKDVHDPTVQEQMQRQATAEFYRQRTQKTELTDEIRKDPIFEEAYKKASAAATAKEKQTGEKTDFEAIKNSALAEYLEASDRAPLRKKVEKWVKKHGKNLLYMLLALVGGAVFKAAEEGAEPARKPN